MLFCPSFTQSARFFHTDQLITKLRCVEQATCRSHDGLHSHVVGKRDRERVQVVCSDLVGSDLPPSPLFLPFPSLLLPSSPSPLLPPPPSRRTRQQSRNAPNAARVAARAFPTLAGAAKLLSARRGKFSPASVRLIVTRIRNDSLPHTHTGGGCPA